ncbi:MAG: 16S rRNA (cytidine(1402)-2'-O)-methyltransferase [Clostridia bacterium]|nr:16S rRNA (cytidine(1402)-2'-O)-methyltransferase [Clostridia bacterium]
MKEKNAIRPGTLYLVSTPIGNLSDISERAIKTLTEVDFVAAEDTRNTGLLLRHFGLATPMISYHEHNKRESGEKILSLLRENKSVALVTDAGTPGISDPGEDLVALCRRENVPVTSVPGCCALVNALILSGLPTRPFCFEGFLPPLKNEREAALRELAYEKRTIVFYEAPHRLKDTLSSMITVFGPDRRIALCREMTKINEEVLDMTLSEALASFEKKDPKGEFVLVLSGALGDTEARSYPENPAEHVSAFEKLGFSRMDAIKEAARERKMPKSEFYKLLMKEHEK